MMLEKRTLQPVAFSLERNDILWRRYRFAHTQPVWTLRRMRGSLGKSIRVANLALYDLAKRTTDVVIASIMLLALSPLLLVVALIVKLTDGGPIIFRQRRVGRWGEPFDFPKFRSMVPNAAQVTAELMAQNHHGESLTFKMKRDPRVTPIGRVIRSLSIDELPQLWCVLQGHMSLVGPRPALPSEVCSYRQSDRRRLDVLPGLTCIWQVSGRADLAFPQQVALDIEYIENRRFSLDLGLLWRTIPAVLSRRGAY